MFIFFIKMESHTTSSKFKSILNTLPIVLETYSAYQNVHKHLVNNVSKFHEDSFTGFGEMRIFHHHYFSLTLSNMYRLSFGYDGTNFYPRNKLFDMDLYATL